MKGIYEGSIPFDQKGNQVHYPDTWIMRTGSWKANFTFYGTVSFKEFARGRSAAYAVVQVWEAKRGRRPYEAIVFLKDLGEMLTHMDRGTIVGTFTFCKRGQNYGMRWLE